MITTSSSLIIPLCCEKVENLQGTPPLRRSRRDKNKWRKPEALQHIFRLLCNNKQNHNLYIPNFSISSTRCTIDRLPTIIFPTMDSCQSTNMTCCLLLQIILTRLHSNFPPKNLLFCLFWTYLYSRQSFHVSRHFSLLQSRPSLTTLTESRPWQRYPIKLQTNLQSQQHLHTPWTSYTNSHPRGYRPRWPIR